MMTSIMQDKKNIHSRSSRITIRILAVASGCWFGRLAAWPGDSPGLACIRGPETIRTVGDAGILEICLV